MPHYLTSSVTGGGGAVSRSVKAYQKEAVLYLVCHEARKGLEGLAHGAVPNDDHAPPLQALFKVGGVPWVQLTSMRPEDLAELLQCDHGL